MSFKFKMFVYGLIVGVILIGLIVPFACQFLLPIFYPDCNVAGAEVWNQFVSIVLGIVATITSVVSLVLGYKSEEQAYETEMRTRELLNEIKHNIDMISLKQDISFSTNESNNKNSKKHVNTRDIQEAIETSKETEDTKDFEYDKETKGTEDGKETKENIKTKTERID